MTKEINQQSHQRDSIESARTQRTLLDNEGGNADKDLEHTQSVDTTGKQSKKTRNGNKDKILTVNNQMSEEQLEQQDSITPLAQVGGSSPGQSSRVHDFDSQDLNKSTKKPNRVPVKDLLPPESKPEDIHKLMASFDMDQIKKKIDRQPKAMQQVSF